MENTKIPLVDLASQYRRYKSELDEAVLSVMGEAAFIGGKRVETFEHSFAEFCGTGCAVGVGNGTDALHLALRASGIGPGDEVIVPANTFIATSEAVTMAGARPVFVDVSDDDALISVEQVKSAITDRTKAILPVHLFGQLVPWAPMQKVAAERDLVLIEDAAQAHGARDGEKRAGGFGRMGCFSFYPGKNLGAYGDAGAVVTDDPRLADRVRRLANHGRAEKYGHDMEGVNSRLDGIQAAVLNVKLAHLDEATKARQDAALRYDAMLDGLSAVRTPWVRSREGHVFHLYVIRVESKHRDALKKHLADKQIFCGVHYPLPLHLQPAYKAYGHQAGDFPVTEALAEQMLSLPMFPELEEAQQARVAKEIRAYFGGAK